MAARVATLPSSPGWACRPFGIGCCASTLRDRMGCSTESRPARCRCFLRFSDASAAAGEIGVRKIRIDHTGYVERRPCLHYTPSLAVMRHLPSRALLSRVSGFVLRRDAEAAGSRSERGGEPVPLRIASTAVVGSLIPGDRALMQRSTTRTLIRTSSSSTSTTTATMQKRPNT